jgi:hypothetical protein
MATHARRGGAEVSSNVHVRPWKKAQCIFVPISGSLFFEISSTGKAQGSLFNRVSTVQRDPQYHGAAFFEITSKITDNKGITNIFDNFSV